MPRRARTLTEGLAYWLQRGEPDECWIFQGPKTFPGGYGIVWQRIHPVSGVSFNKNYGAHRVAWELEHGPIPAGLFVCHHCDNPPCCNPAHLFLGTQKDNLADMARKGRHYSKTKPERVARGDRNGKRTHPESILRGERQPRHKLTEKIVLSIRKRLLAGEHGRALAREFGVDKRTIYRVRDGLAWSWL